MIKIIDAKLNDITDLMKLWAEFMNLHNKISFIEKKQKKYYKLADNAEDTMETFFTKNIINKNKQVLIAKDNKKIVGYSISLPCTAPPVCDITKIGLISDLYISPPYQNKGLSTLFKNKIFEWFKKCGIKHIRLEVDPHNENARNIYKHWGFFEQKIKMQMEIP